MVSQIVFLSQPRSGSHLLERMLTNQPGVNVLAHPFSATRGKQVSWLLKDDYADGMGADERREYDAQMQKDVQGWESALRSAERDMRTNQTRLFVHSDAFFPVSPDKLLEYIDLVASADQSAHLRSENFTAVPDSLLLRPGTIPLISIRDPRLCVPSVLRVLERMNLPHGGSRAFALVATCNIWNCVLYNFYKSHGFEPLVVDADDFMTSKDFVRQLSGKLGLDSEKVKFEWEAVGEKEKEGVHPMQFASQNSLFESSGVEAGRAGKNLDLAKEAENWEGDFGEDAGLVREMIGLAKGHYQWLYERRWKGDASE